MTVVQMSKRPGESDQHFEARVLLTRRGVDFLERGTHFVCSGESWSAAFIVAVLGDGERAVAR